MSFQMDCEYCCKPWAEGHACVGSDLAKLLVKRDTEIERLRADKKQLQDSNRDYCASLVQEIVTLKDENARLRDDILKQNYSERLLLAEQERDRLREALAYYAATSDEPDVARDALEGK